MYLSMKVGSSSGSNSLEKIRLKFWVNFSGERTSRNLSMLSKSIWVVMEMEIDYGESLRLIYTSATIMASTSTPAHRETARHCGLKRYSRALCKKT